MSLRNKIITLTIGLIILLGMASVFFVKTTLTQNLLAELERNGIFLTRHLAELSVSNLLTENKLQLQMLINNFKKGNNNIEYIFILDADGEPAVHTFRQGFPVELRDATNADLSKGYYARYLATEKGDVFDVAAPILKSQAGILHIGFTEKPLKKNVNTIIKLILGIITAVLVIGCAIAVVFASVITRPVHKLTEAVKRVGSGKLDQNIQVRTKDEIGQLGITFNKMINDLRETTVSRDRLTMEVVERKRAEEEVSRKQQELIVKHEELNVLFREVEIVNKEREKIMDSVGDMIILTDDEGKIKRVNRATTEFTKTPYKDILGKAWEDLINDSELQAMTLHADSTELYHKPTRKWFALRAYPFEDYELNFSGTVITIHETTEIRQIADKLEKSSKKINENRKKLSSALRQISTLIQNVTKQTDTGIRLANPNLKKCYEVKNCTKEDCHCHGKDAMRCWQVAGTFCGGEVQGAFAQKYGNCSECEVFKKATSDPIYLLGEQFNNMMHVLEVKNRELEDAYATLKTTQAQILQQEKMASIGQLAAGVAHEINNPMGFIASNLGTLGKYVDKLTGFINEQSAVLESMKFSGTLEMLKKKRVKLKLDFIFEDIGELIKESIDGTERINKIVQNLKSFSRVDEAEYKYADINECIESTLNIIWNELKYKTTVEKEYGELPQARCYPQQLNQVFMNLLVNSAQAIEKQGVIKIKTWNGDSSINISISDTGQGIPEEKINRIFDPFYTTKEVGKGTGLGLSITYDIVKNHNGEIAVESAIGKGTTFTIKIPVPPALSNSSPDKISFFAG